MSPGIFTDDELLDFAVLWVPLGGPPQATVLTRFGIELKEYHRRIATAAQQYLERTTTGTKDILSVPIFAKSVLATLIHELALIDHGAPLAPNPGDRSADTPLLVAPNV